MELIEQGIVLLENEYPDYVDVVIAPNDEDGTCLADGYVHTEDVTVSIDLATDEATEVTRWFAYDATHAAPGFSVGRTNGGYATREEAILALVGEFGEVLAENGFPVDEEPKVTDKAPARAPWGRPEVEACPYLDDDEEFPIVVRILTKERRDTLTEDVSKAIDGLLGEWHPEVRRRAQVAGERLARRILAFFPTLWDAGVDPTIDIRAEVSVDSYGSTWLEDGDPFKSLDIRIYYGVYDDRYDRKDRSHIKAHGSFEFDIYEPDEDDPEPIVHVVTGSGRDCVATDEMGMFVEACSSGVECDEDIARAVDEAFFKFLASVSSALLRGMLDGDGDGEEGDDATDESVAEEASEE